jgi:uncharacterized protein YebE (UPF0316 family)
MKEVIKMKIIVIFFVLQLINVILNTIKSIITIKGKPSQGALINAITYGFYAIIVKQLATLDLGITVVVTAITNYIGVYFSMWLMNKIKKDNLWIINITTKDTKIIKELEKYNLLYTISNVTFKHKNYFAINIFADTQKESRIIRNILEENKIKSNVTDSKKL